MTLLNSLRRDRQRQHLLLVAGAGVVPGDVDRHRRRGMNGVEEVRAAALLRLVQVGGTGSGRADRRRRACGLPGDRRLSTRGNRGWLEFDVLHGTALVERERELLLAGLAAVRI